MPIIPSSNRYRRFTAADNGNTFELGMAAVNTQVSTWTISLNPTMDWVGSFQVQGRVYSALEVRALFSPVAIPYRIISIAGAAQDYSFQSANIGPAACIIQVPANGLLVSLQINSLGSPGYCDMICWDLVGSSAV